MSSQWIKMSDDNKTRLKGLLHDYEEKVRQILLIRNEIKKIINDKSYDDVEDVLALIHRSNALDKRLCKGE